MSASSAQLLLASASPRRRELLERIGFAVTVAPSDIDESLHAGEQAAHYVERLAREKAQVAKAHAGGIVIAADTSVVVDGRILGKPADPAEALQMLSSLSGKTHQVMTGFCVRVVAAQGATSTVDHVISRVVTTDVEFANIELAQREEYVASGEWRGKAGGYAVQGIAAAFTRAVHGSITNVIGLPLQEVVEAIATLTGTAPMYSRGQPS